jgi:hypothetical protein
MSKFLLFLGVCLFAGLGYFFTQSGSGRRAPDEPEKAQPSVESKPESPAGPADVLRLASETPVEPSSGRTALKESKRTPDRQSMRPKSLRTIKGTLVADGGPQRGGILELYAGAQVVGRGESNRKGEFEIAFEVPAQMLVLRVTARGYALLECDLGDQHVAGQQLLGNLFMQRGTALTGLVRDQDQTPVAGAQVVLSQVVSRNPEAKLGQRALTDQKGRFQFGSSPEGRVILSVTAPGYGLARITHFHVAGKQAEINLRPGSSLTVKVITTKGEPVPGANLTLRTGRTQVPPRQAKSDAEGIALFENLVQADWNLHSDAKGYRPGILVNIAKDKLELKLVAWPRAKGKVLAPGGGHPPLGTEVHALQVSQRGDRGLGLPRGTPVAADGSYELLDLRAGSYRVRASAPGFAISKSSAFQVADGSDAQVPSFELLRGGKLSLTLTAAGKPAAGISAEVLRSLPRAPQIWMEAQLPASQQPLSDSEGILRLKGQTPGDIWIILRADGFVPLQAGPFPIRNDSEYKVRQTYKMLLAGQIQGQLKTEGGSNINLGRVRLRGGTQRMPAQSTDQDGRYRFDNVPAGNYTLYPSGNLGGRMVEGVDTQVTVVAGQTAEIDLIIESE